MRDPDNRSRRTPLVAAALGVLALVLLVALFTSLGGGKEAGPPAQAQPGGGTATSPAAQGPPELPDISWIDRQGVDLPVSHTAGPASVEGTRASDFQASELGAVLAAAHITWQAGAVAGPDTYSPTIAEQVTGPSAPALRAATDAEYNRRRLELGVAAGAPLGHGYAEMRGYRVEGFDPDERAVVHLLMAGPSAQGRPSTFDFRTTLVWSNGDWKLEAPPGGRWESVTTPVQGELTGYTPLRKDA